jgi:hypothetical protein
MEVAPALLPSRRDLRDRGAAERAPNPSRALRVGIHGEFETVGPIALLESGREEIDEDGARGFRLGRRNLNRDALELAQRKRLFSLSKKPSSSR